MKPALLLAEVEALGIRLSANGEKLHIDAPLGVLTPELRQRLAEHKTDLLTWLDPDIPQSFKDSPCQCGQYHVINDAEHGWISPCYFLASEEIKKSRPPLSSMDLSEKGRGLRTTCVHCGKPAVWWVTPGATPYCGDHWHSK